MNAGASSLPSKPWNPAAVKPAAPVVPMYANAMALLRVSHGASFWLKKAAVDLDARDPLDALGDAEALYEMAVARCRELGISL